MKRKRTKPVKRKSNLDVYELALRTSRLQMAASIAGRTYQGLRDIAEALGYNKNPTYADFKYRFDNQDIAHAVIARPVRATWKGSVFMMDTNLEPVKEWTEFWNGLKIRNVFKRADTLTSLGRYSVLLLGFTDVVETEQFNTPVQPGAKLAYIKPVQEPAANISKYNTEPMSPRYGLPEIYMISVSVAGSESSVSVPIHHSRIIHLAYDLVDDEIKGTPALKPIYRRLEDLEKLVGGSAEMYWRGARPGYAGKLDEGYSSDSTFLEDISKQLDEYEHDLRRALMLEGVDLKALQTQISDPKNHVDIQIQMISADTEIPKRILTGSERGELSSTQDKTSWDEYISDRRGEKGELLIRSLIDRLQELRLLPDIEYTLTWSAETFSLNPTEKTKIAKLRTEALKLYFDSSMQEVISFEKYLINILELSDNVVTEIMEGIDEAILIESNEGVEDVITE
jgi:hypothetical protein